ncbi:hypothetical protein F5X96DRAFT_635044 [Biscogniauxia mediterranea]|nr:hypothetical protein F5X96DRAFT_635044 [Biscogniauxia mediterranea]
MPADYTSAAQALSIATSPSLSPPPSPSLARSPNTPQSDDNGPVPPWVRSSGPGRGSGGRTGGQNARRLSTPYSRTRHLHHDGSADTGSFAQRVSQRSLALANRLLKLSYSLSPAQRALAAVAGVVAMVLAVLFLVFSHRIFAALAPAAAGWRALPGGWVLVFLLTSLTAFPPMIGYSTCVTIAGFVYGFPGGWPIVASATVVGSTGAFVASRTVLSAYVHRLVGADRRFVALGQVLRHDGLVMLAAIRLCPLPFSLSNGFLATIPSVSPLGFALATALSTPKLLVHVFIGSRLALLAESGDAMPLGDRVVNYLSMLLGFGLGIAVSLVIYRRTMARAKAIAREDAAAAGLAVPDDLDDDDDLTYADLEEGVLRHTSGDNHRNSSDELVDEDAAALIMDADDISLWENDVSGGVGGGAYRDEEGGGGEEEEEENRTKRGAVLGELSK